MLGHRKDNSKLIVFLLTGHLQSIMASGEELSHFGAPTLE
jgi:hypothetical protein